MPPLRFAADIGSDEEVLFSEAMTIAAPGEFKRGAQLCPQQLSNVFQLATATAFCLHDGAAGVTIAAGATTIPFVFKNPQVS
jgi:hypothetical protein